ncbi:MAG: hypothetical protein S4CHLAM45_06470 [Chlamydiales bacterium]|nr:hypothetical protein [Chlamydiales bacterium]MCH9619813.1 hypothetical protein [Chlamydiales bacterium]MCH9622760.1 hypothetical protein [Chlamydiales bacterium]
MKTHFFYPLRLFLILLVIAHHSLVSYTFGEGGAIISNPIQIKWLTVFLAIDTTFFMGLLFFISGYFVPSSYDKSTPLNYLWKKVLRLILPTAVTALTVIPLAFYIGYLSKNPTPQLNLWEYVTTIFFTRKHFTFDHTWFLIQLFCYMFIYLIYRLIRKKPATAKPFTLENYHMLSYFVFLFAIQMLFTRDWNFPQNRWSTFHIFEYYHLPQYFTLFLIGMHAFQTKWIETVSTYFGLSYLAIGLVSAALMFVFYSYDLTDHIWFLQLWSSIETPSLCLGFLILFRDLFNENTPWVKKLSLDSYGAYLMHIFFLALIQYKLIPLEIPIVLKFLISFSLTSVICFGLTDLIRRIPGVKYSL